MEHSTQVSELSLDRTRAVFPHSDKGRQRCIRVGMCDGGNAAKRPVMIVYIFCVK